MRLSWTWALLLAVLLPLTACGGGSDYPRSLAARGATGTATPAETAPVTAPAVSRTTSSAQISRPVQAAPAVPAAQTSRAAFESARPARDVAAHAIRPGDQIEVRFYRNTPLETGRYDLGVGDVVAVDVFGFPELSRERLLVLPDGFVSVPLVGSLRAVGKNVDQIGSEISQMLEDKQILDPQVSVAVVETDPRREALLTGAGIEPSAQITVTEAGLLNLPYIEPIAATGLPLAALQQRIREAYDREFGGRVEVTANLLSRTVPIVFVMGEVTTPSSIELTGPFNPLMAIAAAGGFTVRAEPEEVRVVRALPDGRYQQFAFNLEAGLEGTGNAGAGFRLAPQDVVFVPPSGVANVNTFIDLWIRQNLPVSVGTGFSLN